MRYIFVGSKKFVGKMLKKLYVDNFLDPRCL